jgi:hypothetical protein
MSMYSYCMFMYLHRASWHSSATLTEGFSCFFLSCKANARVKPAKMGHGLPSSKIFVLSYVLFVLCRSVYCLCVNVYCTTATGWLPNCSLQIYPISTDGGEKTGKGFFSFYPVYQEYLPYCVSLSCRSRYWYALVHSLTWHAHTHSHLTNNCDGHVSVSCHIRYLHTWCEITVQRTWHHQYNNWLCVVLFNKGSIFNMII